MMKKIFAALLSIFIAGQAAGQDPWKIEAEGIDPGNYYGETVANGMLGLVSSAQPLQLSSTVLAGCYDKFGRGNVSNFLSGFNFLDTELYIDGQKADCGNISEYKQTLDMKNAVFSGSFEKGGAARIGYSFVSLRQLRHFYVHITFSKLRCL